MEGIGQATAALVSDRIDATGIEAKIPNGWFSKAPANVGRYTPESRKLSSMTGLSIAAKLSNKEDAARKARWMSLKKQLRVA